MNYRLKKVILGSALLLASGAASAAFSSTLNIDNNDCDCSLSSKLYLVVDDNDPYDTAVKILTNFKQCTGGFCLGPTLATWVGRQSLDQSDDIGNDEWGIRAMSNGWSGEYTPTVRYCAIVDNGYELQDNQGATQLSDYSLTATQACITPGSGGNGDCGVGGT